MVDVAGGGIEHGQWHARIRLEKRGDEYERIRDDLVGMGLTAFDADEQAKALVKPYEVVEREGNILVNVGINELWTLACGTGATKFDSTNAYIGVGDGNGSVPTPTASDTDLTAPTNKIRKAMKATYPTYGTLQKAVFQSEYTSGEANWAWREWGVFNASTAGDMLNHKGESLGTKSGGTWTLTVELSIS